MKFLCLAYGAESDWNALTSEEQAARLAQDEIIRKRGALMAALGKNVVTVTAWDGRPELTAGSFATSSVPLAGYSIIEANSIDEVIELVAQTPCPRTKGAVEIRAISTIN